MINQVVGQDVNDSEWWDRIRDAGWQASCGVAVLFPFFALAVLDSHIDWEGLPPLGAKYARYVAMTLPWAVSAAWYCSVVLGAGDEVLGPACPHHSSSTGWRLWYSLPIAFWWAIDIYAFLCACAYWLLVLQLLAPTRSPAVIERTLCLGKATGMYWQSIGPAKPADGIELTHEALSTALAKQTAFAEIEWQAFGITSLRTTHYIRSGRAYFAPMSIFSPRLCVRYLLRLLHRMRDYTVTLVLHTPLILLSFLLVPQWIQSRILFQPTPVFFTRGPTGSCLAASYCCALFVVIAAVAVYNLIQLLGVVPVATLNPFQCS